VGVSPRWESERPSNLGDYPIHILKHIDVPKAQDAIALGIDEEGSPPVSFFIRRQAVLAAVEFNNKLGAMTGKVCDCIPKRNLAAEVEALCLEKTQLMPELSLCFGRIVAQGPGESINH
jgi:hypothetical protein